MASTATVEASYSPFGAGNTTPMTSYEDQGLDASYSGSFENLHSPDIHGHHGSTAHQQPNASPPLPSFADTYSVNVSGSYTCLHRDEGKTESMSSLTSFHEDSSPATPSVSVGSTMHHHQQQQQQPGVMHYHGQYQMITDDSSTSPAAALLRHHQHPNLSGSGGNLTAFSGSPSDQILDYFAFSKHHQQSQQSGNGFHSSGTPTTPQYPPDNKDAVFTHPNSYSSQGSSSGNPFTAAATFQSPYFDQGHPSCSPAAYGMHSSQGGPLYAGADILHQQRHAPYQRRSSLSSMGSPLSPE